MEINENKLFNSLKVGDIVIIEDGYYEGYNREARVFRA